MLTAYFDESESGQVLTLAGYLASVQQWSRFQREWKKALAEFQLPYFHMREYAHSKKAFAGWERDPRRDPLMKRLTWVIKSTVSHAFGIVIRIDEYDKYMTTDLEFPGRSPYFLCHYTCYGLILKHCAKRGLQDDIAIVFDETAESKAHAEGIHGAYQKMRKAPEEAPNGNQLVSLSFADDKKLTPLQAADLFAYEVNKYYRGYQRKSLASLADIQHSIVVWDQKNLPAYADKIRQLPRN